MEEDAEEPVSFNYLILSLALQHICSLEVFHGEKNFCRIPASVHRSFGFTHMQNYLINRVNSIDSYPAAGKSILLGHTAVSIEPLVL